MPPDEYNAIAIALGRIEEKMMGIGKLADDHEHRIRSIENGFRKWIIGAVVASGVIGGSSAAGILDAINKLVR